MNDKALKEALVKRDKLRQEIEKVEDFIRLHREIFGTDCENSEPARESRLMRAHWRRHARPKDLGPIVERILKEHGRPLNRRQLVDVLKERDVVMPSADEPRYLGTVLWRLQNRFVNIEGQGYWPRNIPCEAVGYSPPPNRGANEDNGELSPTI